MWTRTRGGTLQVLVRGLGIGIEATPSPYVWDAILRSRCRPFRDTPSDAHTLTDFRDGKSWQLVFNDEFNVDGRSFYPGDGPYLEAVDLH